MNVLIILAAFVSVASAGGVHYGGAPLAAVSTGESTQFRHEDNYGNYNFGYDESHSTGGTSRREEQTNGVRRGSYSISDADGRHRTVNYIADAYGFRANVETNEPGVEPRDPANVLINKSGYGAGPVAVAGPSYGAVAAPILAAPVARGHGYGAAPVAIAAPAYRAPAPVYSAPVHSAPVHSAPVYSAPVHSAPVYSAPVHSAPIHSAPIHSGPAYGAPAYEAAPRAFSYSFGANHVAPVHGPGYATPAYAAPAHVAEPTYQDRVGY